MEVSKISYGDENGALHTTQVRVRIYDVDATGTVFFTCHQKWFDGIALVEFLKERNFDWMSIVVASITFEYKTPIFLDDLLDITIEDVEIGNKSFTVKSTIYIHDSGKVAATGSAVYVYIDEESRKAVPIPQDAREKLSSR